MDERNKNLTATEVGEREERIKQEKRKFNELITQLVERLNALPLAEGVDKNNWLYAGFKQNIDQVALSTMKYIERCLK